MDNTLKLKCGLKCGSSATLQLFIYVVSAQSRDYLFCFNNANTVTADRVASRLLQLWCRFLLYVTSQQQSEEVWEHLSSTAGSKTCGYLQLLLMIHLADTHNLTVHTESRGGALLGAFQKGQSSMQPKPQDLGGVKPHVSGMSRRQP